MTATDAQDARTERRLRLGIRLVFYPLCLGLIALAWSHYHRGPTTPTPQLGVGWVGATEQGQLVRAVTVDGVFTFFKTRIVMRCLNDSNWTQYLTMSRGEFSRTGDIVSGRQGPTLTTSDQGEPIRIVTRLRTQMYSNVNGTIRSEITRSPGPYSVQCSSNRLTYTLSRAGDSQVGPRAATDR